VTQQVRERVDTGAAQTVESTSHERPPELLRGMYERMLLIRRVEETLVELYEAKEIPGFLHSYIGEEAIAVGACSALSPEDQLTSTHRGHGHLLARGVDLHAFMAEVLGRRGGFSQGKAGSMHLASLERGILGANGVIGGGIPIAGGAAVSSLLLGAGRVVICFFGDGGAHTGSFHEALNLAGLWRLPVVFLCENNGFADFIRPQEALCVRSVADFADSYGMPGRSVDGNDVLAIYDAVRVAVDRARNGGGPTLLEAVSYRWRGHFEGDAQAYRDEAEVEAWKRHDPITRLRPLLLAAEVLSERTAADMAVKVRNQVAAAVEAARRSARPDPEGALEHVYANRDGEDV
jgi:acetoin:2,6-dichlorophenolindophenol oxidoreductase subunit alpha